MKKDLNCNVHRNYLSDDPGQQREILKQICNYFDIYQKDCKEGVPAKEMFGWVMKEMKGTANPIVVERLILEFA